MLRIGDVVVLHTVQYPDGDESDEYSEDFTWALEMANNAEDYEGAPWPGARVISRTFRLASQTVHDPMS